MQRIITHGGCTDGFCSAWIFKRYFPEFLEKEVEVVGLQPRDMKTGEFSFLPTDIVLDLPAPKEKVKFWADHHVTNKVEGELPENYHWEQTPSCASLLIQLLKKKGVQITEAIEAFREASDIMDGALYTEEQIKSCYYREGITTTPTALQKLHMLSSVLRTRDRTLNDLFFSYFLKEPQGETPLDDPTLWQQAVPIFFEAMILSHEEWRKNIDPFLTYEKQAQCVIQDNRSDEKIYGSYDRFYSFIKYPEASYSLLLKPMDEDLLRLGIGSNIFHKDRCKINIGELCESISKQFGDGTGGGHYYVGGLVIPAKNGDAAKTAILDALQKSLQ